MINRLEDKIRDYLADHLDFLEKGLKLVDKEYVLPSPIGAGGRIDIVARDLFGHVVIIEIKRCDKTARQA
jgi:RecB family endonuclease NucS